MVKDHITKKTKGSWALKRIEYYPNGERLRVFMVDGSVIDYTGVPRSVFNALSEAESKGAFFNKSVRNNYSWSYVKKA